MQLKQIIFYHRVKFIQEAVKRSMELNHVNCYLLEDSDNLDYLLDDLAPQCILFGHKEALEKEVLIEELLTRNVAKIAIIGNMEHLKIENPEILLIPEPFSPYELPKTLQDSLNSIK
jgi:hypothetical protein